MRIRYDTITSNIQEKITRKCSTVKGKNVEKERIKGITRKAVNPSTHTYKKKLNAQSLQYIGYIFFSFRPPTRLKVVLMVVG